jgi:hypothetical protein
MSWRPLIGQLETAAWVKQNNGLRYPFVLLRDDPADETMVFVDPRS